MAAKKQTPAACDAVDSQLARYRSMRDFSITEEPSGNKGSTHGKSVLPFVVQKHAATRLHYDFRLGWNGVLKSWAVAKGPSYVTSDKRLAVEVEDHPMEYGGFEGAIPKGQYGGGTVMVWDQGTWEPDGDVEEGLRKGSLKFTLHGSKLQGRWTLVRMHGRAAQESKPNWLLIKEHDGRERSADAPPIVEESPDSIVTGRSLKQIAEAEDHVWQSHAVAPKTNRSRLQQKLLEAKAAKPELKQRGSAAMPGFIEPQFATAAVTVPPDSGWLHELKLDGYRVQAHIHRGNEAAVQLYTRTGLDWTHRMLPVAEALRTISHDAVLDGEVVVLDKKGHSSFAKLQAAFEQGEAASFTYFVFDVLYVDGRDVRSLPLSRRKDLLAPLLRNAGDGVQLSEHFAVAVDTILSQACELGAEGVLSKRADAPYESGRSRTWLKLKCTRRQEFVIAGFTPPKDKGAGIGSILLGYWKDGALMHCGRSGTGFTQGSARTLRNKLEALRTAKPAYANKLTTAERKDAVWVRPELVCEIEFATWTAGGALRHASFQGLREDKAAADVTLETAVKPEAAPKKARPTKQAAAKATALTHPDKVLDAESGVTKQQLAAYYEAVAGAMLPHLEGRPVSIVRCPDGAAHDCFFQKHRNKTLPASVESIAVPTKADSSRSEEYIALQTPGALHAMAQIGVLEMHPWGSCSNNLEKPDRLIFDLDPDESLGWSTVADSALAIRSFLQELGLASFAKTTGGKGLHIVVALEPQAEWPEIKQFARGVAAAIESSDPKLYLIKLSKAARKGRIFLDWLRNERGATAIAPWSPRARAGMRVAMPLDWKELHKGPPKFAVADFNDWKARLAGKHDPWAAMRPQTLAREVLQAVIEQAEKLERSPAR